MKRTTNAADMMHLGTAWWSMMSEAQVVIGMRSLGMMGLWPVADTEDARMVSEKLAAVTQSVKAAGAAAVAGKRPDEVAMAALKPLGRKTRANAKRLSKRKPSGSKG